MAEIAVRAADHERESQFWKDKIEKHADALASLSGESKSRPDAFTGADFRDLRTLIDRNERRLDAVELCCHSRNTGEGKK